MPGITDYPFAALGLLWPAIVAEQASEFAVAMVDAFVDLAGQDAEVQGVEPAWVTPNEVMLELDSVRLRGFCKFTNGPPTLLCAPFALHAATLTDIAPGHSLVEALQTATGMPVFVTDWRSARPDMGSRGIDDYLADLNVLVDEIGGTVNLVGLCQGGWMGLVYKARFPEKVRKLVLAGAPIDIAAGDSVLSRLARSTPLEVFKEMVAFGGGRMLGRRLLRFWEPKTLDTEAIHLTLQTAEPIDTEPFRTLAARFQEWFAWTVDLPGRYYLEVVERLYQKNEIATGRFTALGRSIDLATVKAPIFVLAARDDEVVAPAQILNVRRLVGTRPNAIHNAIAPCTHLGLFMGRQTLTNQWRDIGFWLVGSHVLTHSDAGKGVPPQRSS